MSEQYAGTGYPGQDNAEWAGIMAHSNDVHIITRVIPHQGWFVKITGETCLSVGEELIGKPQVSIGSTRGTG